MTDWKVITCIKLTSLDHVQERSTLSFGSPSTGVGQITSRGKRGLAYNAASNTYLFAQSGQSSQVTWAYNWGPQAAGVINPNVEFVPLLYNNDANLCASWPAYAQSAIAAGTTALMSFNEPDLCQDGSACMNVSTAVATYKKYMQPLAGKASLGAPAITNIGSTTGAPVGADYLKYFLGNCTGCQVDFVNMHWYSNVYAGVGYLQSQVEAVRAVAGGRPIWVTEFGLDSTEPYTTQQLQDFLEEAMIYLDSQTDVARYAYFLDAPGYLLNGAGTGLSATGRMYDNYSLSANTALEIVSAHFADMDVTLLAQVVLLINGVLSVDTSNLDFIFGTDPWFGMAKTLNILYKQGSQYYALNLVENSGSFTITPTTAATANRVTTMSNIDTTSSAVQILGASWGNQTITAKGLYAHLTQAANDNAEIMFGDGLFGTGAEWGSMKSGVVWYYSNKSIKSLAGRDGGLYRFM